MSFPSVNGAHPIRPVSSVSRREEVEERLKEYLAKNQLQPGDRLPGESWFAEQLGVGRPLVREAFKGLEAIGVIEARKGVGRFVRAFEAETYLNHFTTQMLIQRFSERELIETRCLLEVSLACDAVERLTDADLDEIHQLWEAISADTAAGVTNLAADLGLHRVIMSRAENRLIVAMLDAVYALAAGRGRDDVYGLEKLIEDFAQHEAIVRAALARDGIAVRNAMVAHFATTARRLGFEQRWRTAFPHLVALVEAS